MKAPSTKDEARAAQIASELVNVTGESAGSFLKTYGHRLAFCSSEQSPKPAVRPLNYEVFALEPDPKTGKQIPSVLKRWKSTIVDSAKGMDRQSYDWIKGVRKGRANLERRNEEIALLRWAELLRGMWMRTESAEACEAIERIFSGDRLSTSTPPERSAIRVTRSGLSFKKRDLLDLVAWTILEASRDGFLRRCKNQCSAPLFVTTAERPGREYCAVCGGNEANKRRKRKWAAKTRAAARKGGLAERQ